AQEGRQEEGRQEAQEGQEGRAEEAQEGQEGRAEEAQARPQGREEDGTPAPALKGSGFPPLTERVPHGFAKDERDRRRPYHVRGRRRRRDRVLLAGELHAGREDGQSPDPLRGAIRARPG